MANSSLIVAGIAPSFLVKDVVATAEWYRDYLGFTIGDYFEGHDHDEEGNDVPGSNGPVFTIIRAGDFAIQLARNFQGKVQSNREVDEYAYDAYINVADARSLFERLKAAGQQFTFEITDQFYGMTDFGVLDPDGRAIICGQATAEAS